jgi:hypothetical protein
MTRRSLNILSHEEQDIHEVWEWYEFQRDLIGEEKSRILNALVQGSSIATSRYIGKTREELEDDFSYQLSELGKMTMLGMLASTEAALRVDFIVRVKRKDKDGLSRKFRSTHNNRGIDRIRLEDDILDIWKEHGSNAGIKNAVSEFKGALNLRNWLAHGRYLIPRLGRAAGYDPVDIFDICNELLQSIGLMLSD